jgi:predicted HAD superfamily phosphohydrolase YqeG
MIRLPADRPVRATRLARVPRLEARDVDAVWPELRGLEPAALLIDIEPFVAAWRTDESALLRGLRERLDECASLASVQEVVFVTNSRRSPREGVPSTAFPVSYISHARKPFLDIWRFASLGSPVVVIGDQVLTDGLMAWRLNATFVQLPLPAGASFAVRAQAALGRVVASLFFRRLESTTAGSDAPRRS